MSSLKDYIMPVLWTFIFAGSIFFLFYSLIKAMNELYYLKKVEKELKRADIISSNFIIFAIISFLNIASYFIDNDVASEIWGPSFMLMNGYIFYSKIYKKIRYKMLDEREQLLIYKVTARGGQLLVLELFFGLIKHETFIGILSRPSSSWFFIFLYIFNVSLVAFFVFRKNEKEFKLSQEEK